MVARLPPLIDSIATFTYSSNFRFWPVS